MHWQTVGRRKKNHCWQKCQAENQLTLKHVVEAIHIWSGKYFCSTDVHGIIGSGRRAALLLELCTNVSMRIIAFEISQTVHEEAMSLIRSLEAKDDGFKPNIRCVHIDAFRIASLEGLTSISRFCGNRSIMADAIDLLIYRTSSILVYWNNHVDRKNFDNLSLSAEEKQRWVVIKISSLRQENNRLTTFVWLKRPEAAASQTMPVSEEMQKWISECGKLSAQESDVPQIFSERQLRSRQPKTNELAKNTSEPPKQPATLQQQRKRLPKQEPKQAKERVTKSTPKGKGTGKKKVVKKPVSPKQPATPKQPAKLTSRQRKSSPQLPSETSFGTPEAPKDTRGT